MMEVSYVEQSWKACWEQPKMKAYKLRARSAPARAKYLRPGNFLSDEVS